MSDQYVYEFEKNGYGMFVHFGLYSIVGKGEWAYTMHRLNREKYMALKNKFNPTKNWAKHLVKTAKASGCRYITLTTRHHDGFSLYDTCGLNDYDAPHSKCGRDLVAEFVTECRKEGIVPFFYHTLLDWYNPDFYNDFPKYIDYLIKSVEILCTKYGKIGGIWFDGMWSKPEENWQEDRLYGMIRHNQPEAMIINNTGLSEQGKVGHPALDSVTFERGKPSHVDNSDRHRAGEMCQILNDHWGYAAEDLNYKPVRELIENLVECRRYNCNFLLNVGPKGNGEIKAIDAAILEEIGKWIRANKNFIYGVKGVGEIGDNVYLLKDDDFYYAVIKNVGMSADPNVAKNGNAGTVHLDFPVEYATWLDSGRRIKMNKDGSFAIAPFFYGTSYALRVAKIKRRAD